MRIPYQFYGTIVATTLAVAVGTARAADEPATLQHCLVSLIEEAQVPAQEAGVIKDLMVKEGQVVTEGQMLAQIDDAIPQAELKKADADKAAAEKKADSDVDIRYATAAADVALYEYLKNKEAYDKVKNSVPWVEVKRLELAHQRAVLQIEQSQIEQGIAKLTTNSKAADVVAAQEGIKHRQIKSPLAGDAIVVQVMPHKGEWVKPGDTVMRLVRIDRLRVEGFLNSAKISPQDVRGRSVTVTVTLAHHSEPVEFPGKIVFVSPLDEAGGEYRVWAEVDNRQLPGRKDEWLLRPGATVSMTLGDKKDSIAERN